MSIHEFFDLRGRVALVTGASRGIGRAIALALGQCGAAVAVHYVGRRQAAQEVADAIDRACIVQGDLAEAQAPAQIVAATEAALGLIDILVVNASVQIGQPYDTIDPEAFATQVNVNLRSTLELMQRVAPGMANRGWGRILTIGSVQQYRPHPSMLTYAATKAAVENAVRNLAAQLGSKGVTVNNLSPGVILTDRNTAALSDENYARQFQQRIPLRRFGQADDCAAAALLLCSNAGGYITGIDLPVDGGLRLPA